MNSVISVLFFHLRFLLSFKKISNADIMFCESTILSTGVAIPSVPSWIYNLSKSLGLTLFLSFTLSGFPSTIIVLFRTDALIGKKRPHLMFILSIPPPPFKAMVTERIFPFKQQGIKIVYWFRKQVHTSIVQGLFLNSVYINPSATINKDTHKRRKYFYKFPSSV